MNLSCENIYKSFGEKQVLKGINLSVDSGKALGILGRNGAGKTTAIRIIMQVFPSDSGEVLLDGRPLKNDKVNFGYLPEERGLYPKKKIIDQLIYFGMLRGLSSKAAEKNADKLLKRLEMTEYRNSKLDTLSKGNQQKIQLVVTLISDPDIIILDEPFSGLDPVNAMLLKDLVSELISNGKIVLFSSHQMNYVEEFCSDIAILNEGKIVLSGDIKEIKRSFDRRNILILSIEEKKIKMFVDNEMKEIVNHSDITKEGLLIVLKEENKKQELFSGISSFSDSIDEFKVNEPSLNDIFVEYTTGEEVAQ